MKSLLGRIVGIFLLSGILSLAVASDPVDINQASAEQLASTLIGVGPAKAQAIVAYREQNGPFATVDQLIEVKGIGEKLLAKNRENLITKPIKPE